jgi:15-cis-phytoene synthase
MNPSLPLDDSHINRAAPPGSMRYFALLYAPAEKRAAATALFVIDAEIRESAQSVNHDVAHTRLQWWRQEVDRLVNANAQHPATRVLSTFTDDRRAFTKLHELIAAADMDLARMTYVNEKELRAYCSRSGGAIIELLALLLAPPARLDDAARLAANRIGALVRATEIIRDVRQDAYDGRLYLPLETTDQHGIKHEQLREKELPATARNVLASLSSQIREEIAATLASIPPPLRAYFRPVYVLGELHAELLRQIAARSFDVDSERIDLGPIRKAWVAWRAARRAG